MATSAEQVEKQFKVKRWIPMLYNATTEEREKYEINRSRTMIIWDPDKCAINDEVCIADYLGPCAVNNREARL